MGKPVINSWLSRMPSIILFILTLFHPAFTAGAGPLPAALSTPSVGNSIDIRVDSLENQVPAVAYNSIRDEFFVVWEEHISGAEVAIYGQRIGREGGLEGNPVVVKRVNNTVYHSPTVAYSPVQDKFLVVFRLNINLSDFDIIAVQVSGDGGSVGPEIPIDQALGIQWASKVTYNSHLDEYLIVYENYLSSMDRGILATRVKAADLSQPSSKIPIAYISGQSRRLPDAAYNPSRNGYLIAYTHQLGATLSGIKGKIVPENLSSIPGSELSLTTNDQCDGVSLATGPDEYLAVWSENSLGGPEKIWGRRLTGNGTLQPFIKFADRAPDNCIEPATDYSAYWGYVITWRLSFSGTWDIFARTLNASQNTPSAEEFPVSYIAYGSGGGFFATDFQQKSPAIACGAHGNCLIPYEDSCCLGNIGYDYEIRGRLLTPNYLYLPLIKKN